MSETDKTSPSETSPSDSGVTPTGGPGDSGSLPGSLPLAFGNLIPAGDNMPRAVCDHCGFIDYKNPKVVVGSVCTWEDQILLCRRAIEPRTGFWTMPAGYLELDESLEQGAIREAGEEAEAAIAIDGLLAVFSVPHISQVQVVFHGHLQKPDFAPGEESLDVRLFSWDDIPWDDLAFPTVEHSLRHHRRFIDGEVATPLVLAIDTPVEGAM